MEKRSDGASTFLLESLERMGARKWVEAKGQMARKWVEGLRDAKKEPKQVVGDFIARGASVISYMPSSLPAGEKWWNPTLVGEHEVALYGKRDLGSCWAAESLRSGLSFIVPVYVSTSSSTEKSLFMIPYPRFVQEGPKVFLDTAQSQIFLFNGKQVKDLQRLLGLTPTPVAGK